MRKLIAVLLALVLVLSIAAPAFATEEKSKDIVILYTNDVHTYINGAISYDTIAGVKAYLQTQYENVLLVDAGDHAQGTAYGSMDKGKTIIDLMNAAGYDAATLGNHEFDYGQDGRIKITDEWAEYPYLSCNCVYYIFIGAIHESPASFVILIRAFTRHFIPPAETESASRSRAYTASPKNSTTVRLLGA